MKPLFQQILERGFAEPLILMDEPPLVLMLKMGVSRANVTEGNQSGAKTTLDPFIPV